MKMREEAKECLERERGWGGDRRGGGRDSSTSTHVKTGASLLEHLCLKPIFQ